VVANSRLSKWHLTCYRLSKALTLFNVESVHDMGPSAVQVQMTFSDADTTYDHVVSVVIIPEKE
jgi:hypothetical protein